MIVPVTAQRGSSALFLNLPRQRHHRPASCRNAAPQGCAAPVERGRQLSRCLQHRRCQVAACRSARGRSATLPLKDGATSPRRWAWVRRPTQPGAATGWEDCRPRASTHTLRATYDARAWRAPCAVRSTRAGRAGTAYVAIRGRAWCPGRWLRWRVAEASAAPSIAVRIETARAAREKVMGLSPAMDPDGIKKRRVLNRLY